MLLELDIYYFPYLGLPYLTVNLFNFSSNLFSLMIGYQMFTVFIVFPVPFAV